MISSKFSREPVSTYSSMEEIILVPPFRVDCVHRDRGLNQVIRLDCVQIHVEEDCFMLEERKSNVLLDVFDAAKCQLTKYSPLKTVGTYRCRTMTDPMT